MSGNLPCASCKLLRRRCAKDCTFAPYFPSHELQKFAIVHKVFGAGNVSKMLQMCNAPYFPSHELQKFPIVHKVFGAGNVSKMLQELPIHQRADAVTSLVYEANARVRDPVYGCVGTISNLQNQLSELQMQLTVAQAKLLCIQMQNDEHVIPKNN